MASRALPSSHPSADVAHWKTCIPKEHGLLVHATKEVESEIMDTVRKSYLWKENAPDLYLPIEVNLVNNDALVKKYLAKKESMKTKGRSARERHDEYAFAIERLSNLSNICFDGPISRPAKRHLLGDSRLGFRVWQHADVCLYVGSRMRHNPLVLVIYKVMLGRRKMVSLQHYADVHNAMKPTPGYDCHMSCIQASHIDVPQVATNLDQVYLYDWADDTQTHVRHCLPYAVVIIARQSPASPADNMTPQRSLLDRSAGWSHNDFGVTHWRKLLSRRSIEQDDISMKPSNDHSPEMRSHDHLPNLVVRRVVTHDFPPSVKRAAFQWKARKGNRLRSISWNVSARPTQARRLLSDRFSEICRNAEHDKVDSRGVILQEAVSDTGGKSMKDRAKAACIQNDEILKRLSCLWQGVQLCNQGALMETTDQDMMLLPVDACSGSGSSESADGELAADSTRNCSPLKRRKTTQIAGDATGELWASQVIEGNSLKVSFKRIVSPTSKIRIPCDRSGCVIPDGCGDVTSQDIEANGVTQQSVSSCCVGHPHSSAAVVASPSSLAVKRCFVDLRSRVTANRGTLTGETMIGDETRSEGCTDVQHDRLRTDGDVCADADVQADVLAADTGIDADVKSVTKIPPTLCDIAGVKSVTKIPPTLCDIAGVKSVTKIPPTLCDIAGVKSVTKIPPTLCDIAGVKCVTKIPPTLCDIAGVKSVINTPPIDSDINAAAKNVTKAPAGGNIDVKCITKPSSTGSDISTNFRSISKALSANHEVNAVVKCVTTASLKDNAISSGVKSTTNAVPTNSDVDADVTRAPLTVSDIKYVTKVAASDGHVCFEKLAALVTLESYWRVAETLGMAKKTKSCQRQKTSTKTNSPKSAGSKIPRKQTNWSDNPRSSNTKNTSHIGIIRKTKHRTRQGKALYESVQTSSKRGVMRSNRWVSLAAVVQPRGGGACLAAHRAVKRHGLRVPDRSDVVYGQAGGCTHLTDMKVSWSSNNKPVFSTREQPTFHVDVRPSVHTGAAAVAAVRPTVIGHQAKACGREVKARSKETEQLWMTVKLCKAKVNASETETRTFRKEVCEIQLKVTDPRHEGKSSAQMKLPEDVTVSHIKCREPTIDIKQSGIEVKYHGLVVKLPNTEVKLPSAEVKLPNAEVKLPSAEVKVCKSPHIVINTAFYADICRPDLESGSEPSTDEVEQTDHSKSPVLDVSATHNGETDLEHSQVIKELGNPLTADILKLKPFLKDYVEVKHATNKMTISDNNRDVNSVANSLDTTTIRHVTATKVVSSGVHTAVKTPVTDTVKCVTTTPAASSVINAAPICITNVAASDGEAKLTELTTLERHWNVELLWLGEKLGGFEETAKSSMEKWKPRGGVNFHGRTLLYGAKVPGRFIPLHPLYLFHPVRRSGKREVIPIDPRPFHYMRK